MSKGTLATLGLVGLIVLLVGGVWIGAYNKIVTMHEQISSSWAQVDTVLQRRYDLIPNLVETVKGYAAHERGVFEEVARLRSQWAGAKGSDEKARAATEMEGALARLLLVAERYPDLKANQNFLSLQYELAGTENRIAVERRRYNEAVRSYNNAVRRFPSNLIAGFHGYVRSAAYFEAAPPSRESPNVKF